MPTKTKEELQEALYQERFDRLDEKLDDIKDMLGNKASAGSVFRLEQKVKTLEESHIPCATVMIVKKQMEDIEKELQPMREAVDGAIYFNKHPNQLKALIAGAIVLIFLSVVPSWLIWQTYKLNLKRIQMEQQSKTEPEINIPK